MRKNDAVSPVVGVMLMLVVTIIVAAVVAVFASGIVNTSDSVQQIAIKGTYSQSQGMTITHAGGDSISFAETEFMTTPSELMGPDAKKFAWIINKSILYNSADGLSLTDANATRSFKSGDRLFVTQYNCTENTEEKADGRPGVNANARVLWGSSSGDKERYFMPYQFCNPDNIGSYFYLDLVDKSGSIIARAKVSITA